MRGNAIELRRRSTWAAALALGAVLALDWVFVLQGPISYVLTGVTTLLLIPWTLVLFRTTARRPTGVAQPTVAGRAERERLLRAGLSRGAIFVTAVCLCSAKWLVLSYSSGTQAEYASSSRSYTLALALTLVLGLVSHDLRWTRFFNTVSAHPARLLASSFGAAGLVGALLLSLPVAQESVKQLSLVDSLFMAFSAVCVTGLAVNTVAETYSLFGQAVLCVLIQIGGLGIMVLSAAIAILVGQRLKVRSSAMLTEMVDGSSLANLRRTVLAIVGYTLLIEAVGIALLDTQFERHPEVATRFGQGLSGAGSTLWAATFHGISAFCNAGFSNFSAGLIPLRGDAGVQSVLTALIVLGGVGFPVLDELVRAAWTKLRRQRVQRFSLHTRVVLRFTLILLGGLSAAYLLLEWPRGFGELTPGERIVSAVFQAASARTAGFAVVDLSRFMPATLLLTCLAMFIGAAPGSTGGGVKVTTVAALFSGFRSELVGAPAALGGRSLPEAVLRKAVGVTSLSAVIVFSAFFLLLLLEPQPPLELLFETVSAFSTTGLSTGITPTLTAPGKLVIIAMMFIGRIGPLTLALAVSSKTRDSGLRLPEERLLIG